MTAPTSAPTQPPETSEAVPGEVPEEVIDLDFDVHGMTCGSCAARVQRILGRQDGVDMAEVNYATGRAHVRAIPQVDVEGLAAAVDRIGMDEESLVVSTALRDVLGAAEQAGHTAVLGGWDGQARIMLAVADTLKPDAAVTVAALKKRDMEVVLLTGDNEATATTIAGQIGIERVLAGVRPDAKQTEVARLQERGEVVAMVGDGVNDAPALVQADLGIAIGTGTDVAIESSDLTLLRGDVKSVVTAIDLSNATRRTIMQNLGWAFGYNVLAIPVAALGLLSPTIAGAAWRSRRCRWS